MPLSMNRDVFITCAVTGAGDTVGVSRLVPITPKQIAESAIDAAKAGAADRPLPCPRSGDGRSVTPPGSLPRGDGPDPLG